MTRTKTKRSTPTDRIKDHLERERNGDHHNSQHRRDLATILLRDLEGYPLAARADAAGRLCRFLADTLQELRDELVRVARGSQA